MFPRILIAAALLTGLVDTVSAQKKTALDRYVAKADATYSYKLMNTQKMDGLTVHYLQMKSQTWRSEKEVDRPVWEHDLILYVPDEVKYDKAFLFIDGGRVPLGTPKPSAILGPIARSSKSIVANIRQVPNEPLVFAGEARKRTEDEIIAYTWRKFMEGGDEEWPLRLPMTKAAVRAMDTVQEYAKKTLSRDVVGFVVAGASKRGWTTWATAAADKRVVAAMPLVIDVLNTEPSMINHYRAYGFFAPAVGDYLAEGIFDWTGSKEMKRLMEIEDPFAYRDRLTMPKFIINSAGDQFFTPDSSKHYFDQLKGENYLRYIPNSDHGLDKTDVVSTISTYYRMILNNVPRPKFSWTVKNGKLVVTAKDQPEQVKLWQATNPEARDFRLETLGAKYTSTPVTGNGGVYEASVEKPEKGWTAWFLELTYQIPEIGAVKFTTPVQINPDTLPHAAFKSTKGTR